MAILITAMAVFALLYSVKLQDQSVEGKTCSGFFFKIFSLDTRKCFIEQNKKKVISFHY